MLDNKLLGEFKRNITEYIDTFMSCNTAFIKVDKAFVKSHFEEAGKKVTNEHGKESNDYVCGDLQFSYDKDTEDVTEVILFPSYYDDNLGYYNGEDYIDLTDKYGEYGAEVLKAAKAKGWS